MAARHTCLRSSIVLLLTVVTGGCILIPVSHTVGAKPGAAKAGETTRAEIFERLKEPDAMTPDGRFFLYRSRKVTDIRIVGMVIPADVHTRESKRKLFLEFDENGVVKRSVIHKCKKKIADPICDVGYEDALWTMIEELLGKEATAEYRQVSVVETLLRVPLHQAVKGDDVEEIKRLIAQGASVYTYVDGRTPLHAAADAGHSAVVQLLLTNGANVRARDRYGNTPLMLAVERGDIAVVELLIAKGADVNSKRPSGDTVLVRSIITGHTEVAKKLIANGANVETKGAQGFTPLHLAANDGNIAVVEALLTSGADSNAKIRNGRTPLHEAALNGHTGVVELLLANGADPSAKNKYYLTPLDEAVSKRHHDIVDLLKRHGAKE